MAIQEGDYTKIGGAYFQQSPEGLSAVSDPSTLNQLQSGAVKAVDSPTSAISGPSLTPVAPSILSSTSDRESVQDNLSALSLYQPAPPTTPTSPLQTPDVNGISASDQKAQMASEQAKNALATGDVMSFDTFYKDYQDSIKERDKLRAKLLESMIPSAEEKDLKTQLANLRETAGLSIEAEYGRGRPMALSTGRAASQEKIFAIREKKIVDKLNLAQADRELSANIAKVGLDVALEDQNNALKLYGLVDREEQKLYDRAKDLKTEQKDALADVLEQFSGIDPDDITPEVEAEITRALTKYGLSFSQAKPYLDAQWTREELDRRTKELGIKKTETEITKTKAEITKLGMETQTLSDTKQIQDYSNGIARGDATITNVPEKFRSQVLADMEARGLLSLSDTQRNTLNAVNAANGTLDELNNLYTSIQDKFAESAGGRLVSGSLLAFGAFSQTDPQASQFNSFKEAILATLSRALGERGVLTDLDIDRARQNLPNLTDTKEVAEGKLQRMRNLMVEFQNRSIGTFSGTYNADGDQSVSDFSGTMNGIMSGQSVGSTNPFVGL